MMRLKFAREDLWGVIGAFVVFPIMMVGLRYWREMDWRLLIAAWDVMIVWTAIDILWKAARRG